MTRIGEMMDVARKAQDLKRGGIALEREKATLPTDIAQRKAESATAQTQSQSAQWKLKSEQAGKAYELAGSLIQDPRIVSGDSKGSVDALMEAEDRMRAHGIPEAQIRVQMGPMYMLAGHKPEMLRQTLANVIRGGLGAQGQAGQALVPAGQQQQVETNPVTQSPQTVSRDQFGQVQGVTPTPTPPVAAGPRGAQPGTTLGARVPTFQPGDPQEIPMRTQQRVAINSAASKVPEAHFNNQQIIKLADTALVGTGAQQWSKFFSANGMQWVPGDQAANFQRLGHFMALESQRNASAMGAGTDAARTISEMATGSTQWTKEAIKSTAKVNDALASGLAAYNEGMEAAIRKSGGNVLAARDFQNKWSQHFDVRAMQLHNALENGDKEEVAKIVKEVGGAKSPGAQNLLNKTRNLDKLIQGTM